MNYDLILTCSVSAAIILILVWVVENLHKSEFKTVMWYQHAAVGLIGMAAIISTFIAIEAIRDTTQAAFDSEKTWLIWVE